MFVAERSWWGARFADGAHLLPSYGSVQRARDCQHQKDVEEQQIQLQKSEQAEARQASRQLKARLLQERRVA
jgi:reverse gyrase